MVANYNWIETKDSFIMFDKFLKKEHLRIPS